MPAPRALAGAAPGRPASRAAGVSSRGRTPTSRARAGGCAHAVPTRTGVPQPTLVPARAGAGGRRSRAGLLAAAPSRRARAGRAVPHGRRIRAAPRGRAGRRCAGARGGRRRRAGRARRRARRAAPGAKSWQPGSSSLKDAAGCSRAGCQRCWRSGAKPRSLGGARSEARRSPLRRPASQAQAAAERQPQEARAAATG